MRCTPLRALTGAILAFARSAAGSDIGELLSTA
jgi:hypothetical protein